MTGAPLSLWRIRVELTGRAKPQEDDVTIVTLGATESFVSSMEPVENSHHTIVLIKPIMVKCVEKKLYTKLSMYGRYYLNVTIYLDFCGLAQNLYLLT